MFIFSYLLLLLFFNSTSFLPWAFSQNGNSTLRKRAFINPTVGKFAFAIWVALMNTVQLFLLQETHVIHTFKEDFYGEVLSVVMVGYIRPEKSFDSLGETYLSLSLCISLCISLSLSLFLSQELFSSLSRPPFCWFLFLLSTYRSSHRCYHSWHWGGQSQAGGPGASQIERGQLLYQRAQLVFLNSFQQQVHVSDNPKRPLTAVASHEASHHQMKVFACRRQCTSPHGHLSKTFSFIAFSCTCLCWKM